MKLLLPSLLLALSLQAQSLPTNIELSTNSSLVFDPTNTPPPWYRGTQLTWEGLPLVAKYKIDLGPTTNSPQHWKLVWKSDPNAELYNIYQSTNALAPLTTWYIIDSCKTNEYQLLNWPAKFTNCPACFYIVRPVYSL